MYDVLYVPLPRVGFLELVSFMDIIHERERLGRADTGIVKQIRLQYYEDFERYANLTIDQLFFLKIMTEVEIKWMEKYGVYIHGRYGLRRQLSLISEYLVMKERFSTIPDWQTLRSDTEAMNLLLGITNQVA